MNKIVIAITLLLVLNSVQADFTFNSFSGDFSSNPAASGIALSDIITVANFYGCKTWVKNQCTQCSQGYFFSKKGVCCEIPTLCSEFNRAEGVCLSCYQGYIVVNNSCCQATKKDNGCAVWKGNTCVECSKRWFMNKGVCTPVSDQCATWDSNTGSCLTCYNGYAISAGACISNPNPTAGYNGNPLCGKWSNTACLSCSARAYFNSLGVCTAVSDQCETFDPLDGSCLTCYGGYTLKSGTCVKSATTTPSDLGCSKWNTKNSVCLECSQRYYYNGKQCLPVSDQCKTWSSTGSCLSCYDGYDLANGVCKESAGNKASPKDLGCGLWDWKNNKCLKCSDNWVFNNNGVCVPVSDQCNTYDLAGNCVTCYKGYNLVGGKCVQAPVEKVSDLGCGLWDWSNKKCLQCSSNYVFNNNGVCVPVSDQCKTFDLSGKCVSCYDGYNLVSGKCEQAPIEKVSDLGCGLWDWKNKKCLQCSSNWVFNNKGVCTPVSDQCKTFDLSGSCVSCYDGYNLVGGKCVEAPIQKVTDLGCGLWDWKNNKCLQCSSNWVFDNKGICIPVSDQCKTFDLAGRCVSCYDGYNLVAGKCEQAPIEKVSDLGCGLWDWKNKKCLQCSSNWVFNNKGVCTPVSDQCKTFDLSGSCVSCYDGYNLVGGKCVEAPIQKVTDLGCGLWDWKNSKCLKCSDNWVFNNKGVCTPVSDQCNTYDLAGNCITCYKGYNLVGGKCVLAPLDNVPDAGCGKWDWDNKVCLLCSYRYVFNSLKKCVPVNDNCNLWNNSGDCTSCYPGYILNGGKCTQGNSLCQSIDSNGACTACYTGYILDNGNCVPISKLANLALYYSQCCPQRLASLKEVLNGSSVSPFKP